MEDVPKTTHVRNWKNYLIGLLVIAVTLLWFTRSCDNPPADDSKERAYQDTIRTIRAQDAVNDAKQDTIYAQAAKQLKQKDITIERQNKRIAAANARAVAAEAKISQLTKDEHPEVVEAL